MAALALLFTLFVAGNAFASACNGSCDFARDVIIDREGRIVFIGSCEGSTNEFGTEEVALWRLNEDGSPDLTFGDGGVVLGPVVGAAGNVLERADGTLLKPFVMDGEVVFIPYGPDGRVRGAEAEGDRDVGSARDSQIDSRAIFAVMGPDGSIVVLDGRPPVRGRGVPPVSLPRLLRFYPDGTQDVEFASASSIAPDLSPPDNEPAVVSHHVIDREGRIVVLGATAVGSTGVGVRLWRFRPDGNLDTDFGDDGVVTRYDTESDNGVSPFDVSVDRAGRVFVTGSIYRNVTLNTTGLRIPSMAVWCFTSDGRPDESFGENGRVEFSMPLDPDNIGGTRGGAMLIDQESRVVILGYVDGHGPALWRYLPDGTPDESFGENGYVTPESYQRPLRLAHFASAMAIDTAGRIVIVGHRPGNEFDAVVWRLNSDGSLDESFGTDGFVQYDRHYGFYVSTRGWDL